MKIMEEQLFQKGCLPTKLKLLMLCACTTILKSPYMHTVYSITLEQGVSEKELIEATSIALLLGSTQLLQKYKLVLFHSIREHSGNISEYEDEDMFFSQNNSEVNKKFSHFYASVYRNGLLSPREKELIALAVSLSVRCVTCIDSHTNKARIHGATDEEISEAKEVGAHMLGVRFDKNQIAL